MCGKLLRFDPRGEGVEAGDLTTFVISRGGTFEETAKSSSFIGEDGEMAGVGLDPRIHLLRIGHQSEAAYLSLAEDLCHRWLQSARYDQERCLVVI